MADPNLRRKSPRLPGYDYAQSGGYFVTICTDARRVLFGEIVDDVMLLNPAGQIAAACWDAIPGHFPHVELDLFIVMPNHVHGIVFIIDSSNQESVGTRHASSLHASNISQRPRGVEPGSLGAIIGSYKSAVTYQIHQTIASAPAQIWQERYHDHIIRNDKALQRIREYILYNPALWQKDRYYENQRG